MKPSSYKFTKNSSAALQDVQLQKALGNVGSGFIDKRKRAIDALPEFEALRIKARQIKDHTLDHLDLYLEQFEQQVIRSGGQVHWARTPAEARQIIVDLCQQAKAKIVTKGKSMVGEEIDLNTALEQAGMEAVETDLGEYIIQLAHESPSHIIAPAIHKTRAQIAELFHEHHAQYGLDAPLDSVSSIVDEARRVLRDKYIRADVGITGANFLIAETGSAVIVTNEGNGDLTASLPETHIVLASLEKVVPTLEDTTVLLRVLARSATGQEITAYTTFFTGPRRQQDLDGPNAFHVVLLDNGRSEMLGNEYRDMLRCIRCGACLNHCPVYQAVGGHAYGWVYPGPMGSVLTPLMLGLKESAELPNASSLCGRCEEVCPMSIPLPQMLRAHRNHEFTEKITPARQRLAMKLWSLMATRPFFYRIASRIMIRTLKAWARGKGTMSRVPLAGAWTGSKDLPAPQGKTFFESWKIKRNHQGKDTR